MLVLAGFGGLAGMLASDPGVGVDELGFAVVGLAGLFGYPVHLVIHEAGHLLVALLVGLRVTDMRISLRRQGAVTVRPAGPALAVRMAAVVLGGPLANLAAAALAWQLLRQPLPAPVRMAAALAGAIGLVVAVMNLLPIRLPGSTLGPRWAEPAAVGLSPAPHHRFQPRGPGPAGSDHRDDQA